MDAEVQRVKRHGSPLLAVPLLWSLAVSPAVFAAGGMDAVQRDAGDPGEVAPDDGRALQRLQSLQRELTLTRRPDPHSTAAMVESLDARGAEFEDERDVKCWSSFGQLETFVAGTELRHETTHLKAEVVMNYLDQLWRASITSSGGLPVPAERFEAVATQAFPRQVVPLREYRVALGPRSVVVPYQDVENYAGTVEPTRLLRTLAQRVAGTEPDRAPLSEAAIDVALFEASLLSTALLKEANVVARASQHERIEDADVLAVDRAMATVAGLEPFDESKRPEGSAGASPGPDDSRDAMLAVIREKIESLETFNTEYSAEKLARKFDTDLSRYEAHWGGIPLDPEASRYYREQLLVELARFFHAEASRRSPGSGLLSGRELLATIVDYYPFITAHDGLTSLFPQAKDATSHWVPEYQADTFRDTGWHWRALRQAVEGDGADPSLPGLDLYALEELSEFLSVYAVGVVSVSGRLARDAGRRSVSREDLERGHRLYASHSQAHHAMRLAEADGAAAPPEPSLRATAAEAARRSLREAYIAEVFTDVTPQSGIDFLHESSDLLTEYRFTTDPYTVVGVPNRTLAIEGYERRYPRLEIGLAGGGVAVGDVDGDGRPDIYLVNGKRDRLYRNTGGLRFEDVTQAAGLENSDEGRGAYFIDYDNDGDQDLFVTHIRGAPNRLFRNDGDGRFEDVTGSAGLPVRGDAHSHSAVWFDYDNDGNLDLYVGNFGAWLDGERPRLHNSRNGLPNQLFRNDGHGRFEDVTERTHSGDTGWAHAVSHFDANGDGWQDLYIANDFGRDALLLNIEGERFIDFTPPGLRDQFLHGMSVSFTDVNGDGIDDVYVSNIAMFTFVSKYISPDAETSVLLSRRTTENTRMIESNIFLVSADGSFVESHHDRFERSVEGAGWAWDADFFDFDNDGLEDLYILNGREPNLTYDRERNVLYKQWDGHFYDISSGSGADFRSNARGAVHADLDGDGDLDVIVNNYLDRPVLLRNNLQRNNWVQLQLEGTASNRDAVGARVRLVGADRVQARTVRGGSGFLSKEPNTVHFGLSRSGGAIPKVEIDWPSGRRQELRDLAPNRLHHVREPEGGSEEIAVKSRRPGPAKGS